MYKIYINDTPLLLIGQPETGLPQSTPTELVAHYPGKSKFLLHYIDMLENTDRWDSVSLYSPNLEEMWADFQKHFKLIEAAGGLVVNTSGQALVIFRRGYWDMPKGKLDKGETPPQAALREVEEETGLQNLTLGRVLPQTYHTYRLNKKRILKRTYWYEMQTTDTQLVPQTEEDIEKAEWVDIVTFLAGKPKIYGNILALLESALPDSDNNHLHKSPQIPVSMAPWLSVPNGELAATFYKSAFGAKETYRLETPDGVVARLAVAGAEFWISGGPAGPEDPDTPKLGGDSVRMILTVPEPEALFEQALGAGATEVFPVGVDHGWKLGRLVDPFGLHWEIGHPVDL